MQTTTAMLKVIAGHARNEARARGLRAAYHKRLMKMEPGTPEREHAHSCERMYHEGAERHKAAYMAVIEVAHHAANLTDEEIHAAIEQGKRDAGHMLATIGAAPIPSYTA